MDLSKEAKIITSIIWQDDGPRATNFVIGNTYTHKGETLKTTEKLYDELVQYQQVADKPFKINRSGKIVNVVGIRNNHKSKIS